MVELKPYPEYQDSGVPWLGKVPRGWGVRRLRDVVELRISNVDKHHREHEQPVRLCNYVEVYRHERIHASMNFMRATASPEEIKKFRLEKHDVIITKDSETWDDIGVPALVESISPDVLCGYHLAILRPRKEQIEGPYLLRAIQSKPVSYQFHVEATGITRYGLGQHAIKSALLPLPPLQEQQQIARFLDWKTAQIDRLIRAKRRLVELLKEQQQALLHQVVTGQIDVRTGQPYPEYQDSGIPWLGKVPRGWKSIPLKRIADFKSGVGFPVEYQGEKGEELPFVKVSDMNLEGNEEQIIRTNNTVSREIAKKLGASVFPSGTIIFPKVGGALLTNKRRQLTIPSCIDNNIMGCVPKNRQDTAFILLLLSQLDLGLIAKPGPVPAISEGEVKNISVQWPTKEERCAILDYVKNYTQKIRTARRKIRREVELLQEYRTRLIADVVTGKLDVRGVNVPAAETWDKNPIPNPAPDQNPVEPED